MDSKIFNQKITKTREFMKNNSHLIFINSDKSDNTVCIQRDQ